MTHYLFDLEGTLVSGKAFAPLPDVADVLARLSERGDSFSVLTNNTTHAPDALAAKLADALGPVIAGVPIVSPVGILADMVAEASPRTLVIGSPLVREVVAASGGIVVEDDQCDLVVLGGGANADEEVLSIAVRALLDHGAQLVGLHKNKLYVDEAGAKTFGVGGLVAGLEYCSGVTATVLGKPSSTMYNSALPDASSHAVMVSDDFYSDLAGAGVLGIETVFVATGKYSLADLDSSGIKVDRAYATFAELL